MIVLGDLNFRVETVEPRDYDPSREERRGKRDSSKERGGYDYQRARAMAEAPEYPELLKQLFHQHDRLPNLLGASCPALLLGCHDATALAFAHADTFGPAISHPQRAHTGADSAGGGNYKLLFCQVLSLPYIMECENAYVG